MNVDSRILQWGYAGQAGLVLSWWAAITISPSIYGYFAFEGVSRDLFFCFALPDLLVLTALSGAAAALPGNAILRGVVLGGFLYAALFCVALSFRTASGYLGTTAMLLAVFFNAHLALGRLVIRRNRSRSLPVILLKTFVQSAAIWTVTLAVIPGLILHAEGRDPFAVRFGPPQLLAAVGFLFFATLCVASGWVMAARGRGTPAPFDAATELVTTGPYAYVRNPMAFAGLGLGLMVATFSESVAVALYVGLGIVVWNFFIRPVEERDLEAYFGAAFVRYRNQVGCWIPRLTPYRQTQPSRSGTQTQWSVDAGAGSS